jgi:hypothetical protein
MLKLSGILSWLTISKLFQNLVPIKKNKTSVLTAEQNKTHSTSKEIIYYIHGWQHDTELESLIFESTNKTITNYYASLNTIGYTLYTLSWFPFAQGKEVKEIQKKIWMPSIPLEKKIKLKNKPQTVIDVLEQHYIKTIKKHPGKKNRLVGHSLGAQAALRLAEQIIEHYPSQKYLWPSRIALLDPAFVKGNYEHFENKNALELSLELIDKLKNMAGIAFECYRSSLLTHNPIVGLSNSALIGKMAFVDLKLDYIPFFHLAARHSESKNFYFGSFFSSPKGESNQSIQHALSSEEDTKKRVDCLFHQIEGKFTSKPGAMIFRHHHTKNLNCKNKINDINNFKENQPKNF